MAQLQHESLEGNGRRRKSRPGIATTLAARTVALITARCQIELLAASGVPGLVGRQCAGQTHDERRAEDSGCGE